MKKTKIKKCKVCGVVIDPVFQKKIEMLLCREHYNEYRRKYRKKQTPAVKRTCSLCGQEFSVKQKFKRSEKFCNDCFDLQQASSEKPLRFSDCSKYAACLKNAAIKNKDLYCEGCRFYDQIKDIHLRENPEYLTRTSEDMTKKIKNSERIQRHIREKIAEGYQVCEIAALYSVDERIIRTVCGGVAGKKRKRIDMEGIQNYLDRGWSIIAIARHYDVADSTIHRRIKAARRNA